MDKTRIKLFGKQLRQRYVASGELPFPMRKALEALGKREKSRGADELPRTLGGSGCDPVSTSAPLSRNRE